MLNLGDGVNLCIDKRRIQAELATIYWHKLCNLKDGLGIINKINSHVGKPIMDTNRYQYIKDTLNNMVEKLKGKEVIYDELIG